MSPGDRGKCSRSIRPFGVQWSRVAAAFLTATYNSEISRGQ